MYRNQVATSSGIGWRIAAELGGDIKRNTHIAANVGSGFGLMLVIGGIISIFMGNVIGGLWWFMIGLFVRSAAQRSYQQLLARNLFHLEKKMLNDFEKKILRSEKS